MYRYNLGQNDTKKGERTYEEEDANKGIPNCVGGTCVDRNHGRIGGQPQDTSIGLPSIIY